MKNQINNQILKMALVLVVIFSLVSCKQETIKEPLRPTPTSGMYDIKENATSGIANLLTEQQIVDLVKPVIPDGYEYVSGKIIAENAQARLVLNYSANGAPNITLTDSLTNKDDKGYLYSSGRAIIRQGDSTIISQPTLSKPPRRRNGHITLLR